MKESRGFEFDPDPSLVSSLDKQWRFVFIEGFVSEEPLRLSVIHIDRNSRGS